MWNSAGVIYDTLKVINDFNKYEIIRGLFSEYINEQNVIDLNKSLTEVSSRGNF
jgi:hypothetical protein